MARQVARAHAHGPPTEEEQQNQSRLAKGYVQVRKTAKTTWRAKLKNTLIVLLLAVVATAVGWLFRFWHFPEANIVVIYILFVLVSARYTSGYAYGLAATVIATCAFNYFFTIPYFTLSVDDPTYFITFFIMTLTSVITSALTSKVNQNAMEAKEKEAEASALYRLTNHLTDADDIADIARIAVSTMSEILNCRSACLCFDENGLPESTFIQQKSPTEQVHRNIDDRATLKHRMENLRTAYDEGPEFYDWPIYGRDMILGVIRIPSESAGRLNESQIRMLRSMIESTALAMDRYRSATERLKSNEAISQERYRGNLLRAISHDLRTPLAGILGTSEMLMGMTDKQDNRHALAEDIHKDADWLFSLVENILNLTRLQDGKLVLNKQMEAVEEVVGVAVAAIAKRAPDRDITVALPKEVRFIPMDARLIEQVLVNLLDNAIKHTPSDKEISIHFTEDSNQKLAVFTVSDDGCGIDTDDLPHVFQMFYTARRKNPDAHRGIGLGLAICESIITAHGGTIVARNRENASGAEFQFSLPMEADVHAES